MTKKWTAAEQAEHRALWAAELRSGKYRQATGQLRMTWQTEPRESFCCLGVACLISGLGEFESDDWFHIHNKPRNFAAFGTLPYDVKDWLGLQTSDGAFFKDEKDYTNLALLNDHEKLSFEQIANVIESEAFLKTGVMAEGIGFDENGMPHEVEPDPEGYLIPIPEGYAEQ